MRVSILIFLTITGPLLSAAEPPKAAQVMGLLKTNCISCHNAEKKKGGLSLETRELALKGGEHGAAFVAGKSAQSRLIRQLAEDSDPHMPPKKQLAGKAHCAAAGVGGRRCAVGREGAAVLRRNRRRHPSSARCPRCRSP